MKRLLKSFKTELRLNESQKDKIRRSLGICRFLANQYIARNIWLYRLYRRGILDEKQRRFVTANDFDKYVNHTLKKKFPWIDQCGSKARKKVLVNAEQAFRRFFKGQAHFPRFKRKNQQNVKLYFPKNNKGDWTIWRHKIQVPTIGKVRLKEFGYLPQGVTIKNGHVSWACLLGMSPMKRAVTTSRSQLRLRRRAAITTTWKHRTIRRRMASVWTLVSNRLPSSAMAGFLRISICLPEPDGSRSG